MSQDGDDSAPEPLAPNTITERLDGLEPGDEVTVNSHKLTYEVVDTDTYSVIAEDPTGHRVTFAQNLQTGGWTFSEDVAHIDVDTE